MFDENTRAQILGGYMQDFKSYMAGRCYGYLTTISMAPPSKAFAVTINAYHPQDPGNAQLLAFIQQQRMVNNKILDVTATHCAVTLILQMPGMLKNSPSVINDAAGPVINWLQSYGYLSGCHNCGNQIVPVNCYNVNDRYYLLCDACAAGINNSLAANQREIISAKAKFIPGLVGAFLGSLIGVALWVLINQLGFIAGIAGLAIGVCAFKGYEKLGGHLDKRGVICSIIIMVFMVFLGNKLSWSLAIYKELKEYGISFFDCFKGLNRVLDSVDAMDGYIRDLVFGYVLTAVSSFGTIVKALKETSGSYTMKKM